jgi:hypothetical protein
MLGGAQVADADAFDALATVLKGIRRRLSTIGDDFHRAADEVPAWEELVAAARAQPHAAGSAGDVRRLAAATAMLEGLAAASQLLTEFDAQDLLAPLAEIASVLDESRTSR